MRECGSRAARDHSISERTADTPNLPRGQRARYCALRYCRFAVCGDNVIATYREGLESSP